MTDSWTNSSGGDWNVASNWTGGVPTSLDDAVIGVVGGYTVTLTTSGAANSLTISDTAAKLALSGVTASLTVQTALVDSGTLSMQSGASASIGGSLGVANGGSLFIDTYNSAQGSRLTVAGDLSLGGTMQVGNATADGASLVTVGGTLFDSGTLNIFDDTSSATVVSASDLVDGGTINLSGDRGGRGLGAAELLVTSGVDVGIIIVNNHSVLSAGSLVVQSGGAVDVLSGGTAAGVIAGSGGSEIVSSGGATNTPAISGGLLDLTAGAVVSGAISFAGSEGTLEIDGSTMPTNTIGGFQPGDTIDLRALTWSATNSASFDSGTNTLTVSGGATVDTLTLTGIPAGTQFTVTSDGHGGTFIEALGMGDFGSTTSGIVLSDPLTQNPSTVVSGAYVTNNTAAYNGDAVYGTTAAAWTFSNYGTINATATTGSGVDFRAGGTVTNAAGALIAGFDRGIYIGGAAGYVFNLGTIAGTGTANSGVSLHAGGAVTNTSSGSLIVGPANGVFIDGGPGTVVNYGTIAGTNFGVDLGGAAGTVSNRGTILSTDTAGRAVFLDTGGSVANGIAGGSAGSVIAGAYGIEIQGGAGTVANFGTVTGSYIGVFLVGGGTVTNGGLGATTASVIEGTGASGVGVLVEGGGLVVNGAASAPSGTTIDGDRYGVWFYGTAGTVSNYGTINATGISGAGVDLHAGGTVSNAAGAVIAGYNLGVYVSTGVGVLTNYGTVATTGTADAVIDFGAGGTVANLGAAALISGDDFGVDISGGAGTVVNGGTIAAAVVGTTGAGVILSGGGNVVNNTGALISGYHAIDIRIGGPGTVVNYGTVAGDLSAYGYGVRLRSGGDLTNAASGLITGFFGADILSGGGALNNQGTILATRGAAYLTSGAAVNGGPANASALITGFYGIFSYAGISVTNYGTIIGTGNYYLGSGIYVGPGGTVVNAATGLVAGYEGVRISGPGDLLTNYGTIVSTGTGFGAQGVDLLGGGTLVNRGTILATSNDASGVNAGSADDLIVNGASGDATATIAGWFHGIDQFGGIGTVVNYGTITANDEDGVYLAAGGTVTNQAGGLITGISDGVQANFGAGTIDNAGTISGQFSYGVGLLFAGGAVTNEAGGVITGYIAGVRIGGYAGAVVNAGTIASDVGGGIYLVAGGSVTNTASGRIDAYVDGIFINGGPGTVTNFGTIQSTLSGGGAAGVFIVDSGGLLINGAPGTSGASIVVASGGAVEIGTYGTVVNYGTIANSAGGSVYLGAGGAALNAASGLIAGTVVGVRIAGAGSVANYGMIESTASYSNAVTIGGGGLVTNAAGGVLAGYYNGVRISGAAGTVINSGTILGTGLYSGGPSLYAGGAVLNNAGGFISGLGAGVWIVGGVGTVSNYGTIVASGPPGFGILLEEGSATNAVNAAIYGHRMGIYVYLGSGTVTNLGTITGAYDYGVRMTASGAVTNGAPGISNALIVGRYGGVVWGTNLYGYGSAGTVTNYGTIANDGFGYGVALYNGGSVSNAAGALITGYWGGVYIGGGGAVSNSGTITGNGFSGYGVALWGGGVVANDTAAAVIYGNGKGVFLEAGGTVTNVGTIAGGIAAIDIAGGSGSVLNYGTLAGGYIRYSVNLEAGGSVVNGTSDASTALITGGRGGVYIRGGGTVTNYGTINDGGLSGYGVALYGGGFVSNAAGAVISGTAWGGVYFGGAAGTVSNFGTISDSGFFGYGVALWRGGAVVNAGSAAVIYGNGYGIYLGAGGMLANFGTIVGGDTGVYAYGGASIVNYGWISGYDAGIDTYGGEIRNLGTVENTGGDFGWGVRLGEAGTLVNGASTDSTALISGYYGVKGYQNYFGYPSAFATIVNYGTIDGRGGYGFGIGIGLYGGGAVVNGPSGVTAALITGERYGVYAGFGAATVTNYATIAGAFTGVEIAAAAGEVINDGLIVGTTAGTVGIVTATGVSLVDGGTIVNRGTIAAPAGNNSFGIDLGNSATVINGTAGSSQGVITGYHKGINFSSGTAGAVVTVVNYGTIASTQPGTAAGTGLAGNAICVGTSASAAIVNFGTIVSAETNGGGAIFLGGGGSVENGATNMTAALIQGGGNGINIQDASGTVINFGTIAGTGANNPIYFLHAGGVITNGASNSQNALIIGNLASPIYFKDVAGTVVNYGTIVQTGHGTAGQGVNLRPGGVVINQAGASIVSYHNGVSAAIGIATVVNYGTIVNNGSTAGGGVYFGAGGTLSNNAGATISAIRNAVNAHNVAITINNAGLIENSSTFSAIYIHDGGIITNALGGAIDSAKTAISFNNTSGTGASFGTVINAGSIVSTGSTAGAGVYFGQGGILTNTSTGIITAYRNAISVAHSAGTVVNFGTVAHVGADTSGVAVYLGAGGIVTNYGLLSAAHTGSPVVGTTGGYPGVVSTSNQPATVVNFGTIANPNNSNGVNLLDGGLLINGSTADTTAYIRAPVNAVYIGGTFGVPTAGAIGTVINYGTIVNTTTAGSDVRLVSGGTVSNHGLILSARTGVSFGKTAGTIDNFGTIVSTAPTSLTVGVGAYLQSGGLITNEAGGLITALRNAVVLGGNTTPTSAAAVVVNSGAIVGYKGVSIGAADTGNNTIVNYGTIVGTSGIAIALGTGTSEVVIEYGSFLQGVVSNFLPGDSFDLPFLAFDPSGHASLMQNGTTAQLQIVETSGTFVISLDPNENFAGDSFNLSNDGGGGTAVDVVNSPNSFSGTITAGIVLSNPATQIPATVNPGAYVTNDTPNYGGDAVYGTNAAAWTLSNYGTINATQPGSAGVLLAAGGTVINGPAGVAAALIAGAQNGVVIDGSAGTVVNYGTILATTGNTVYLGAGGVVINSGVVDGGTDVVLVRTGSADVNNSGVISGSAGAAVWLADGGTAVNSGLVSGMEDALFVGYTAGLVVNSGTIVNACTTGEAVCLYAGGSVTNTQAGLIVAPGVGVAIEHASGSVVNLGTISGVSLYAGGGVTNGLSGLIAGGYQGIGGDPGVVVNSGTVTGVHGIRIGGLDTVTNLGAVTGTAGDGIYLLDGGDVVNGQSGSGAALIAGGVGVLFGAGAGTVTNYGTIRGSGSGYSDGVYLRSGGEVANFGAILGTAGGSSIGVLGANAVVRNQAGGLILGSYTGVGGTGTVINYGSIGGLGTNSAGVFLGFNGVVSNYGTISGGPGSGSAIYTRDLINVGNAASGLLTGSGDGLFGRAGGALMNLGTIVGDGFVGVGFAASGSVVNGASGATAALIEGADRGVSIDGGTGTVVNYGTIASGTTAGYQGVYLGGGGAVTNRGVIVGGSAGIEIANRVSLAVFNTGNGATTDGYVDPHWTFSNAVNGTGNALVANNPGVDFWNGASPWAADTSTSSWIVDNTGFDASGGLPQVFSTTFDLTGFDPSSASLSGAWGIDDSGFLELNGNVIASLSSVSSSNWQSLNPFFVDGSSGFFLPGINTLSVVLNSADGAFDGANVEVSGTAISLVAGSNVTNTGTIASTGAGGVGVVFDSANSTLTTSGTISAGNPGGTAVSFSGGGNRLIVEPGAVFSGVVNGGGGADDVLELAAGAAGGTIDGLGGNFFGFDLVDVDPSAVWQLTGATTLGGGVSLADSGTLTFAGGAVNDGTIGIAAGATLVVADTLSGGGMVDFTGAGATLEIDSTAMPANAIGGVQAGDTIDLRSLAWSAGNTVSFNGSTLTVTGGGTTDTLTLSGVPIGVILNVSSDGHGGTAVTAVPGYPSTFSGTITGGIVLHDPSTQIPATITSGAYVTNNTAAYGGDAVYGTNAAAWTLTNYGTVNATSPSSDGIDFAAGGLVVNQSGAQVFGTNAGIEIRSLAGTLDNAGTVSGYFGVYLSQGGSVVNGASAVTNALIDGTLRGVSINNNTGTVTNFGTIVGGTAGVGVALFKGGSVTNQQSGRIQGGGDGIELDAAGTVVNSATIAGLSGRGMTLAGGSTAYNGAGGSLGATIFGGQVGVQLAAGGASIVQNGQGPNRAQILGGAYGVFSLDAGTTVTNSGTIVGTYGVGVYLDDGGRVTNQGGVGAIISGANAGVEIRNATGTVNNAGTVMAAGGSGVELDAGGSVNNQVGGVIVAAEGVRIIGTASVNNTGIITGNGTSGSGVYFSQGGGVNNSASAAIDGTLRGVTIYGNAGTVTNFGTIAASIGYGAAIYLQSGGGVTNQQFGRIQGGGEGIAIGGAGTVVNSGTIAGLSDTGVLLAAGGTIVNKASGASVATIAGGQVGVLLESGAGAVNNGASGASQAAILGGNYGILSLYAAATVTNYGSVAGIAGAGVYLSNGGTVTNALGGHVSGANAGIEIRNAAGSVSNAGTVTASSRGIELDGGGSLTNQTQGIIVADDGVRIAGGGTVINSGTVVGAGTSGFGVYFSQGGSVNNNRRSARVVGTLAGVIVYNNAGTVTNSGTIAATATYASAVDLLAGGSVTNQANALIQGGGDGIAIGGAGTVTNSGTIAGLNGAGVALTAGGSVVNTSSGSITGYQAGVEIFNAAVTVANYGTIAAAGNYASGIYVGAGGSLTNQGLIGAPGANGVGARFAAAGTVVNSGTVSGEANGVVVAGGPGTVVNTGSIVSPGYAGPLTSVGEAVRLVAGGYVYNTLGGTITGGLAGVYITGDPATVSNAGGIFGLYDVGVDFQTGGRVLNQVGGLIEGKSLGVYVNQGAGSLTNAGTITGGAAGIGVDLVKGGVVANTGLILAGGSGSVDIGGGFGTVTNYGTIVATGSGAAGVNLAAGGTVTNSTGPLTGALIQGGAFGVEIGLGGSTVVNAGTIVGGSGAVELAGAGNRVVVDPGAVFSGVVDGGGGGNDVLELAAGSAGSIGGLGSSFVGFDQVAVDAAAHWLLTGSNAVAAGSTLSNAGILDVGASLVVNGGLADDGTLNIEAGATLEVGAAVSGAGAIDFAGNGATLRIDGNTMPLNTVGGFTSGTFIDLAALPFGAGTTATLSGNTLIVTSGGITDQLTVAVPVSSGFDVTTPVQNDGQGGTLVTVLYTPSPVISAGETRTISSGETDSGLVVLNGGTLIVLSGGTAIGTTDSGTELLSGGLEVSGTVAAGGLLDVLSGGTASAATVMGGSDVILGGGTSFDTVVSAGIELVSAGGVASGTTVLAGGEEVVSAGGVAVAPVLAGSGFVDAGGTMVDPTIAGANLELAAGAIVSGPISFAGAGGVLQIDGTTMPSNTIAGFGFGDSIDLRGVAGGAAGQASLGAGNGLTISESGSNYTLQLDPSQNFTGFFTVADDGRGGTLVQETPDTTSPVTQTRVLAVDENSGATPIGIQAPADLDNPAAALTVTVTGLPSDGTVLLSDGTTAVTSGEALTVDQLTGLEFLAAPNTNSQSSRFSYTVTDPAGNAAAGTAFLGINRQPPPNSPALVDGLGGPEGFGENALPANDDGSSAAIDITSVFGGGLNFFGHNFTSLYVNNNGNITFNGPLSQFTPGSITAGVGNPIIAPFWADVDTRGGPGVPTGGNATGSNTVYYDLDTVNHVFTVTWDDVGYYAAHTDKLNAFQLQLIQEGGGNFDIVFRYQEIDWTTGDASGGVDGLGGTPARAGFSAGDGVHSFELPQSGDQNAMLQLDSAAAPAGTQGATDQIGVYDFQVRNGVVIPPAPTDIALSAASDSGLAGDDLTNVITPVITGQGVSGDTISVLDGGAVIGSGTVAGDGSWAVTLNPLSDGTHVLTATETDSTGTVSPASTALSVTIDTSAPVSQPGARTVLVNSGAAPIGILAPSDADDAAGNLTITVTGLPGNGTVTLADGITALAVGQTLSVADLTGLEFAAGGSGSIGSFSYSVVDRAGNATTGDVTFTTISQIVGPGQTVFVPAGATIDGITVLAGGVLEVGPGATVSNVNVEAGALEIVSAGGTDIGATVASGGFQDLFGTALNTLIVAGGHQTVEPGGTADGTLLDDAAVQTVFGTADGTTVSAGDTQSVQAGGIADGTTVSGGGSEVVLAGGLTSDTTIAGGTLDLTDGGRATGFIAFAGPGGVLEIDGTSAPEATITGFARGDDIDLRALASGPAATVGFNAASGILTVSGGGIIENLLLGGVAAGTAFAVSADGHGGTLVTETAPAPFGLASISGSGVTTPVITGSGEVGDNVTLLEGNTVLGSATVGANGQWSVTSAPLAIGTHTLTATETDALGDVSAVSAPLSLTIGETHLFDFVFTYNDGKDYYYGKVADDGSFGYSVGDTLASGLGKYVVFFDEGVQANHPSGEVSVTAYSHFGPGQASTLPVQGTADGTAGLGSESDFVIGTDGAQHAFSSSVEATFPTAIPLFGFVYTYADGAYYTGSVADNGSFNTASHTVFDAQGRAIGSYAVFNEGVTTQTSGTVVIDRFTFGTTSIIPTHGPGGVDGTGGLGTEAGTLIDNQTTLAFSAQHEPAVTPTIPTLPNPQDLSASDVATAEVNELYSEVLGRAPDPSGLAAYTAALEGGASPADIRAILAQSPEVGNHLGQLYQQVLGRPVDASGLTTYTNVLLDGSDLDTVQVILAESPEAQGDLQRIYQDVLARGADSGGLNTYTAALADPLHPQSLSDVRNYVAHSFEARDDLAGTSTRPGLFQPVVGRTPNAAELIGMEDLLANGSSQTSLQGLLAGGGSGALSTAGGYSTVTAGSGDTVLTAQPGTPTLFVFGDITVFGHDTINGFDPTRDAIQLSHNAVGNFTTLQNEISTASGGSLITLNPNQSIQINGVAPASLTSVNFTIA